jgi:hypothetical protein
MPSHRNILAELDTLIAERLFGESVAQWLTPEETNRALSQALTDMGLLPHDAEMTRNTTLGIAIEVDVHLVFLGLCDPGSIPWVLEEYGLMDADETDHWISLADHLFLIGSEQLFRSKLRARVRHAYREYQNRAVRH